MFCLLVIFADAAGETPDDEDDNDNTDKPPDYQVQGGEEADLEGLGRKRPLAFVASAINGFNSPVIGAGLNVDKAGRLRQPCLSHTGRQREEIEVIGYLQCIGNAADVSDLGPIEKNEL